MSAANFRKDDLLFLPLGGAGEIGMNVNLYHHQGKWIMFDMGAGFADEFLPGIDLVVADLSFVIEHRKDFLGIVLTHAHEDHIGGIPYLWGQLRCPIYATPFTASMVRGKLEEAPFGRDVKITEITPGSAFEVGPFSIELVQITHSIPEMNGMILRTSHGTVLHTGDWKLDPDPVIGPTTDEALLKRIGDEGVLAMVCDSTNIFREGTSGSEADLHKGLSSIVVECKGLVAVATFASNVARLDTIARVAAEHGRQVVIAGRSLGRVTMAARENGYLADLPEFLNDRAIGRVPRREQLVICTGCQGEPHAAISKIAGGRHPNIRLAPGDAVIFSSRVIPGNEKKIIHLLNTFVKMRVEVYSEKDHFVHVSGHPCRDEVRRMYELVRPKIAIPVHGEAVHLHEHVKFAKALGVPKALELRNGELIRLAPGEPEPLKHVRSGYLAVDGKQLLDTEGRVIKARRRMQREGIVFVGIVLSRNGKVVSEPRIFTPGLLDEKESGRMIYDLSLEVADVVESQRNTSEDNIVRVVRSFLKKRFKQELGKEPMVEVAVGRV